MNNKTILEKAYKTFGHKQVCDRLKYKFGNIISITDVIVNDIIDKMIENISYIPLESLYSAKIIIFINSWLEEEDSLFDMLI